MPPQGLELLHLVPFGLWLERGSAKMLVCGSIKEECMVFHKKSTFCFVPVSTALVASSLLVPQNSEARQPRAAQSQEKVSVVG